MPHLSSVDHRRFQVLFTIWPQESEEIKTQTLIKVTCWMMSKIYFCLQEENYFQLLSAFHFPLNKLHTCRICLNNTSPKKIQFQDTHSESTDPPPLSDNVLFEDFCIHKYRPLTTPLHALISGCVRRKLRSTCEWTLHAGEDLFASHVGVFFEFMHNRRRYRIRVILRMAHVCSWKRATVRELSEYVSGVFIISDTVPLSRTTYFCADRFFWLPTRQ